MKKIVVLLVMVLAFAKGNAQLLNPVKWTTQIEKKSEGNYVLTFNGVIDTGWHLYSQFTADGGSLPLEVLFKNQKGNFELIGKTKESKTKTAYNDIFEVNETFFEKKAQLTQEIHVTNPKLSKVEVSLNYQVCKEACINLEKNFTFIIPSSSKEEAPVLLIDTVTAQPVTTPVLNTKEVADKNQSDTNPAPVPEPEKGLLSIFIIAFFSGFAALLTPCVFPMIPMTVSFFTKQSKSKGAGVRNAVFYGDKAIDRSPCGTGTSARLAHWHAKGKLQQGEPFKHESIIGSVFIGKIEQVTQLGEHQAIIPSIEGWAKIYGFNTISINPKDDPYAKGFQVV